MANKEYTDKDLVKRYEDLSGRKGEFEVKEGLDSNQNPTTQVWNTATGSLVAEVVKGSEHLLINDPQAPTNVDHFNEVPAQVEYQNGQVVDPDAKSTKKEKAATVKKESKTGDGASTAKTAEKKAEEGATPKTRQEREKVANKQPDADKEKTANQNPGA